MSKAEDPRRFDSLTLQGIKMLQQSVDTMNKQIITLHSRLDWLEQKIREIMVEGEDSGRKTP